MRRAALLRSIVGVMGEGTVVTDAAYMWTRHRWMVPYTAIVFAAIALLAPIAGVDDWPTRIVLGLAGAGVGVAATTEYRVLAQIGDGLVLLRASRIRQVATELREHVPDAAPLLPVGGTVLAADWQVGDRTFTVARSSEGAMQRMAATRAG